MSGPIADRLPAVTSDDEIDWAVLSAAASTLDERLAGRLEPTGESGWEALADRHLGLWCQSAAFGDPARFERRLARDGLTPQGIRPLLGPVRWKDPADLPAWVGTARGLLAAIAGGIDSTGAALPGTLADDVPFADLIWPAVQVVRRRRDGVLADSGPAGGTMVDDQALADLDAALLRRFAEIYGLTLFESFNFFRMAKPDPMPDAAVGCGIHDAFVAAMRDGVFANLIRHKPVMIRLLAVIADQWIAASAELLRRLIDDRYGIAERFSGLSSSAPLTGLDVGISDPHDHGRGVAVLRFADGGRIVYKPRDLSMEEAWYGLIDWLIQAKGPAGPGAARTWCRPGYGWMEWVDSRTDIAADTAPLFFRRVGGMLAMMRWLRASDMHEENVFVRDGMPVPIDLETVLQPNIVLGRMQEPAVSAEAAAQEHLDNSVLAVGLLPKRMRIAGREREVGGLASPDLLAIPEWRFTAIGRDDMAEQRIEVERSTAGLALTADGEPLHIADHASDVAAGFRDMVTFLAARRSDLFAANGPVAAFADCRLRHVLRPTAYYEILRREACWPANQSSGVAWSRHFDRLTRSARWDLDVDPGWSVLPGERTALARYDVPLLLGRGATTGCWIDGEAVAPDLLEPAIWPQLGERLDRLATTVDDEARIIVQSATGNVFPTRQKRPWDEAGTELDDGAARSVALSIAEMLAERAIRVDGAAAWIGITISADGKGFDLKPLDASLYGGQAGIALFFAACFRTTGDGRWRSLALEALAAIRFRLGRRDSAVEMRNQLGIGGVGGLGSVVYALTRTAALLEAPDLLEDAGLAAALIDDAAIAVDRVFDVISGAAGAALGLLSLHRVTGNAHVLERAAACGRHIPAQPRTAAAGTPDWRGAFARPLTGFSHGAAGMSYALLRLHAAGGEAGFLETARRGLQYERSLFDREHRNWPDLRSEEGVSFPCQWCHGAAGIGLARLAALDVLDDAEARADIAAALATTVAWPDADPDHLCCGNAGRLVILDTGGRILGDASLRSAARRRAAAWLKRAGEGLGGFVLPGSDPVFRLGLFQGLPGIGYALLQLSGADDLPNPLILS